MVSGMTQMVLGPTTNMQVTMVRYYTNTGTWQVWWHRPGKHDNYLNKEARNKYRAISAYLRKVITPDIDIPFFKSEIWGASHFLITICKVNIWSTPDPHISIEDSENLEWPKFWSPSPIIPDFEFLGRAELTPLLVAFSVHCPSVRDS